MVVIITGASRGIGFATAKYFAGMKHCEIYALSRNKAGLGQLATECAGLNKSSQVHPMVFDLDEFLLNPDKTLKKLTREIKQIDILINNAGLLVNKPFLDTGLDEISRLFHVNCIAPAMLIRQLIPLMGRQGPTHVVNISSMGGFQGSQKFPGLSYYSASKAALACLTECLSEEFKDTRIAFNCLALGSVQTEMLEEAFPGYKAQLQPGEMAEFIGHFALTGHKHMRGKVIPVSIANP
ncbi:MAG: SDR family oxidoreductase [Bacteroidales bacterium]|nr:SDR family oxidoreductase [Bacteroidales bacterium]